MKNTNKTHILIIFLLITLVSIIVVYSLLPQKNMSENTKFVIINTYSNYAWGTQFSGSAIFDDGSIYTWNETDNSKLNKYKLGTPEGLKEFILKEGKRSNDKVSKEDLNKIKKYIYKLENNIEIKHPGADQGTNTISVITNENMEIVLKKTGDSVGENRTLESQNIMKIVEKYFN